MARDPSAIALEDAVGHPGDKVADLLTRVASDAIKRFSDVQTDWLDLMWTLDAYRIAGVPPRGMGESKNPGERLAAVYRGKGNWFARLLAALLENQTTQRIAPQIRVQGFSQFHQIDLAWPVREEDPLLCAETKVTGAPAYGSYPERGALSDFTNRRKELKFAATDLKLWRRDQDTSIDHWRIWRQSSPPKTYFLWASRLRRGQLKHYKTVPDKWVGRDDVSQLVKEAQALVNSYLDGAGIFAWQLNAAVDGYEPVKLPLSDQVSALDDVLYAMASEIKIAAKGKAKPPEPVRPDSRAVSPTDLLDDQNAD